MNDRKFSRARSVAGVALSALIVAAFAAEGAGGHAYLEAEETMAGTLYEVIINLPHGCDGLPTDTIAVKVPDNMVVVQPPAADGWSVSSKKAVFDKPKSVAGEAVTEGYVQLKWSGGSIPDDEVGQVSFQGLIVDDLEPGTKLHFLTVQHCQDKSQRWIEIQKPGQELSDMEAPAPFLTIIDETMSAGTTATDKVDHSKHSMH